MKYRFLLMISFACIVLCSCGRDVSFEAGSVETDIGFVSSGNFDPTFIKPDFSFDGFTCTDASYISNKFYYSVINYSSYDLELISFDSKGSDFTETVLEHPDISSESFDTLIDYPSVDGLNLYFYNPFFTDDSVSGYCCINGAVYSDESQATYITDYYLINWDIDGSVKSVEPATISDEEKESCLYPQYFSYDSNGYLLSVTDAGVVRSSFDGKYADTYFDFINSSFDSSIDKIVYANEDLFSALTFGSDGSICFTIFNRSDKSFNGVKPISLYCSSLSDDLKNQIFEFNNSSNDYRIGIRNYSDIYRDYNDPYADIALLNELALFHLEEDVLSGDVPDLIFETSGLDSLFVNRLASKNVIVDLKDSIKSDKALDNNKYLTNIYNLYDADSQYAVIPSFTFDTYVTSALNENLSRNWTLDEFVNYKSLIGDDMIIMDSYSSTDFMSRALTFNGYSWINISSGDATFGDDYKTYLKLASQLPSSYDEFTELAMSGQIPVYVHIFYKSIGNLAGDYLSSWKQVASHPVNLGFPTNTNSDRVIHPTGALMMCSDRAAAQECWEFVRSFLLKDYQDSLTDSIPVLQSSFDKWKTNTSYEGYSESELIMTIDDQLYTAPSISSDKVELLSNMIVSCYKYYFIDPAIEEIVLRNAALYFDGSVTVDEAAANTEKEVEEYLKGALQAG